MTLIVPIGNTYTGNTSTGNTMNSSYGNGSVYLYVINTGAAVANVTLGSNSTSNYASIPVLANTAITLKKAASDLVYGPSTVWFLPIASGAAY